MPQPLYTPAREVRQASDSSVGALFATVARLNAKRTALAFAGERQTYAELNARVNRLAHVFHEHGIGHGDRIGLLAQNCMAYVEVELAAAKIGAITAALNWRLTASELSHCIELAAPALLIVQQGRDIPASVRPDSARLLLGPEYEAALAGADAREPAVPVTAEDGLQIIYTSGTTGVPKGALISHRAIISRSLIFAAELGAPRHDTFVAWTPLFHMGASDFTFATLLRGGCVEIIDGYRPDQLISVISGKPVHYLPVVPGMIADFIDTCRRKAVQPKGIGMIGAMADLVPRVQLAEITALLHAPYLNTFGSTETGTPPASAGLLAAGVVPASLSKRQTNFCQVRLVDADDRDVAQGEPGELAILGPSLFSGYWRDEEANADAFRNGWFHMGDVFRRNADGTLDFIDRLKYTIKSGAENIYPAEIERVVLSEPRIADAVVVRKPDARWGEVPVLFAVRTDASLTAADLLTTCRGALAGYKQPAEVHFVETEDIPRTNTGKVQRHALEVRLRDRS